MASASELRGVLAEILGAGTVDDLVQLSGGASRDTWRFVADGRPLVVQVQRPGDERDMLTEAAVVRAAHGGGVPVPAVVDARRRGDGGALMILELVEGETIPRRILRDLADGRARTELVGDIAEAAARIHRLDPGHAPALESPDPVESYTAVLDELGEPHPVLELVRRWLHAHRPPPSTRTIVHGDFRLGNLIIGSGRLRAVIDWELAHVGDPMEDLGWLCVKAWRFGGRPPVAGIGETAELIAAYEAAGGRPVDADVVRWWEVLGTWKWAIMCIAQAAAHRSGAVRSHELAAIGRRVCENEHDLFLALEGRW